LKQRTADERRGNAHGIAPLAHWQRTPGIPTAPASKRTALTDDCQCITSARSCLNKQELLQRAAQSVSLEDFRFEDMDIRLFGDVAIIHALNPYTSSNGQSGASQYTDIWVKRHST
jgi:Domain of unknown function (DUF4440)